MNAFARSLSPVALALGLLLSTTAHSATPAAPAASAPIDAEKQKLIDRILAVIHPENITLQAIQQQGVNAMQQSSIALQTNNVPQDRKEKALKDIQVDVQKYVDTTMPMAVDEAKKAVGPQSSPILAATFTTDELRQLAAMLESPLRDKLEKVLPQMQQAVGQKMQSDIGEQVNKNNKTMAEAVSTKLRAAVMLK